MWSKTNIFAHCRIILIIMIIVISVFEGNHFDVPYDDERNTESMTSTTKLYIYMKHVCLRIKRSADGILSLYSQQWHLLASF